MSTLNSGDANLGFLITVLDMLLINRVCIAVSDVCSLSPDCCQSLHQLRDVISTNQTSDSSQSTKALEMCPSNNVSCLFMALRFSLFIFSSLFFSQSEVMFNLETGLLRQISN